MAQLKANTRGEMGSRKARSMRAKGLVPAIIYGHGEATMPVSLELRDVETVIKHGDRLLELTVEGAIQNVLVKEVQYDSLGSDILHLDLARVRLDERVEVTVPIMLRGTAAGAADGGVLQQVASQVRIECLVTAIPDDIRASVAEMKLGDQLKMGNLPLPEGAKLLDDPDLIVATVSLIAEAEAAPAEEGVAEPEVIGAKKEEEAEGEEAPAKPEKKAKE